MFFDKLIGQSKCELCGEEKLNLNMTQFDSHTVCKECIGNMNLSSEAMSKLTFNDLKSLQYNSWDLTHLQINDIIVKSPDISLKPGEYVFFS